MNRRTFLRLAASAGLLVTGATLGQHRGALADGSRLPRFAVQPEDGPFWVTMHAGGGWDPTLLFDPKGRLSESQSDPVNNYFRSEIEEVGAFQLAPLPGLADFFRRWGSEVLVVNGIDTGTNSHETGVRHTWSGTFDLDAPAVSALIAATQGEQAPAIAFLSYGGYDQTAGLVPRTRLPRIDDIELLANPTMINAGSGANNDVLRSREYRAVERARRRRMERQMEHASLHRESRAVSVLHEVRATNNDLARLEHYLPEELDSSDNPLRRQAQVACAAFRAGLTWSASLSTGGFDTHGNHDDQHIPRLERFMDGVDFLLQEADRQGVLDRLNLVVGSDFARTPWYNSDRGKDHWSITSMMFAGPSIRGGRVIGGTDDGQRALLVDPDTLAISDRGVRLTPAHIHRALRELAGVADHPSAQRHNVPAQALDLFG